jgi:hypothetical protein
VNSDMNAWASPEGRLQSDVSLWYGVYFETDSVSAPSTEADLAPVESGSAAALARAA